MKYCEGKLEEAISIWKKALVFDQENKEVKSAIETATQQLQTEELEINDCEYRRTVTFPFDACRMPHERPFRNHCSVQICLSFLFRNRSIAS